MIYPYVVAGGFTVAKKNDQGRYDAQFGLILTDQPQVCEAGYVPAARAPQDQSDRPMGTSAGCNDAQQEPPWRREGAAGRMPPRRTGHRSRRTMQATGKVIWSDQDASANIAYDGGAAQLFGDGLLEIDVAPAVAGRQPGVVLV